MFPWLRKISTQKKRKKSWKFQEVKISLSAMGASTNNHQTCLVVHVCHCGMLFRLQQAWPAALSPGQGMNYPGKTRLIQKG